MNNVSENTFNRRDFLKAGFALGGVAAVGGLSARVHGNREGRDFDAARTKQLLDSIQPAKNLAELPNIVLIPADDLGYGDLGAYGGQVIQTVLCGCWPAFAGRTCN